MITVFDSRQDKNSNVTLVTVNCNGIIRYWYMDDIEELHKEWWSEDYNGPASDDSVLEFSIESRNIKGVKIFEDIVQTYNFDKPFAYVNRGQSVVIGGKLYLYGETIPAIKYISGNGDNKEIHDAKICAVSGLKENTVQFVGLDQYHNKVEVNIDMSAIVP